MFVSRSMTRKVITVEPDDGIFKAQELMAANKIRHLPVIESDGRLIGIVTDRDIRSALPYKFFKESPSEEEKKNYPSKKLNRAWTSAQSCRQDQAHRLSRQETKNPR